VALGEARELDSVEPAKVKSLVSHVLHVAIQLEVEVPVGELAAQAHFAAAAAVSTVQGVLSQKHPVVLLGSRKEWTSTTRSAITDVVKCAKTMACEAHMILTSQYCAHCARYGWYTLPSVLTCCPGRKTMSWEGVTYTMGGSRG
jgi:hypothetical protein